jgi:hypothetical protein
MCYSTLDPGSFTLRHDLTEDERAELAVELQFYGLLDRIMPYFAQEQIAVALLKRACEDGTKSALQTAVAQARALVFEMGSTTPWLTDEFQDARYVITDRIVTGAPVWAAEDGRRFIYRAGYCAGYGGKMFISDEASCATGKPHGVIYHNAQDSTVMVPTQLLRNRWRSNMISTLGPQFTSAGGTEENRWVWVPDMRVAAVHGLDDAEPAMAAALRHLAALPAAE